MRLAKVWPVSRWPILWPYLLVSSRRLSPLSKTDVGFFLVRPLPLATRQAGEAGETAG
jgi:hypothetical protein